MYWVVTYTYIQPSTYSPLLKHMLSCGKKVTWKSRWLSPLNMSPNCSQPDLMTKNLVQLECLFIALRVLLINLVSRTTRTQNVNNPLIYCTVASTNSREHLATICHVANNYCVNNWINIDGQYQWGVFYIRSHIHFGTIINKNWTIMIQYCTEDHLTLIDFLV